MLIAISSRSLWPSTELVKGTLAGKWELLLECPDTVFDLTECPNTVFDLIECPDTGCIVLGSPKSCSDWSECGTG